MNADRIAGLPVIGKLILVVGPSGVGKDSLIDAARRRFAGKEELLFPARHITRPADAGGEAHVAISKDEFIARQAAGVYCLSWQAHGLDYGIPRAQAFAAIGLGKCVLINVSRRIVPQAEALGVPVAVLHVTAQPQTLARRLAARGRESAEDIAARLQREAPLMTRAAPVIEIANDADLAAGEAAFIAAVERLTQRKHDATQ